MNALKRDEMERTQFPEDDQRDVVREDSMRERLSVLWHGTAGRVFRYIVIFTVVFLFIFLILIGLENGRSGF